MLAFAVWYVVLGIVIMVYLLYKTSKDDPEGITYEVLGIAACCVLIWPAATMIFIREWWKENKTKPVTGKIPGMPDYKTLEYNYRELQEEYKELRMKYNKEVTFNTIRKKTLKPVKPRVKSKKAVLKEIEELMKIEIEATKK